MSAFAGKRVTVKGKKVIVRSRLLRKKLAEFDRKEPLEEPKK